MRLYKLCRQRVSTSKVGMLAKDEHAAFVPGGTLVKLLTQRGIAEHEATCCSMCSVLPGTSGVFVERRSRSLLSYPACFVCPGKMRRPTYLYALQDVTRYKLCPVCLRESFTRGSLQVSSYPASENKVNNMNSLFAKQLCQNMQAVEVLLPGALVALGEDRSQRGPEAQSCLAVATFLFAQIVTLEHVAQHCSPKA